MIHHLNCGSLAPYYPQLRSIVYCLLVESSDGLVLVDTGFGTRDYAAPSRMMAAFLWLMRVPRDPEETALRQVERLGYRREDVRHIVLTHLHLDHAGGLPDFPEAQVHVYRQEYEAALHPRKLSEWGCDKAHRAHGPHWVMHDPSGERWLGFDAISIVPGLKPRMLLVPLPGHTRGHCGVAVEDGTGWLLAAGDSVSPFHPLLDVNRRPGTPQPLAWLPAAFVRGFMGTQTESLRALLRDHGDEVRLFSGHDLPSFEVYTRVSPGD